MANSSTNLDLLISSQAQKEVTANAMLDALSPSSLFGRRASTTAALTWGYYGGTMLVNGTPTTIANGTVALTASLTNYVETDQSGAVSVNTTGWTAGKTPLYQIVAGASTISSYTDMRVMNSPVFGSASISVAGGVDVTLSAVQARNKILSFTGTLTANINVILPAVPFVWTVYNNTSGAYTLTAKTAAGTGITIPQGQRRTIYSDGTNIYAQSLQNGDVSTFSTVTTSGYTVATLPTGSQGMRAFVTDAVTPSFLGALTGGGTVVTPVFHNGTAWVAG